MTSALACVGVTVDYGSVRAVNDLDLELAESETLALLGPSGSGKSTVMYAVAGLVGLSAGRIELNGHTVSAPGRLTPPEQRAVGLVFQNYALWPHLTARDTVAFPLRRSGMGAADARAEARRLLDLVGIGELHERRPAEMSGGQQQRVGLARALARKADLFLFDEPTAHLDATVKTAVQTEIRRRRADTGAAAIYSTHDSQEAMAVADRVAIIREGRIVQEGTPTQIYEEPIDRWVAELTGPVSALSGPGVITGKGMATVSLGDVGVAATTTRSQLGGPVVMLVRPEWVQPGRNLEGRVVEVSFHGPHTDYLLNTPIGEIRARQLGPPDRGVGDLGRWDITRAWLP